MEAIRMGKELPFSVSCSPNVEAHRRNNIRPLFCCGNHSHGLHDTYQTEKAGILLVAPCLGNTMKMHLNPDKT